MKKKLIQILMLLVAAVSVGSFVSCKDTNEDLYNELRAKSIADDATLREALETRIGELEDIIRAIESCECDTTLMLSWVNSEDQYLQNQIDLINTALGALSGADNVYTKAEVDGMISGLNTQIDIIKGTYVKVTDLSELTARVAAVEALKDEVKTLMEELLKIKSCECDCATVMSKLGALEADMTTVKEQASQALEGLKIVKEIAENAKSIAENAQTAADNASALAQTANTAATEAKTLASAMKDLYETAAQNATDAKTLATEAKTMAENNEKAIKTINETLEKYDGRITLATDAAQDALDKAAEAYAKADANEKLISSLTERVKANETNIKNLQEKVEKMEDLAQQVGANTEAVNSLKETVKDLNTKYTEMGETIAALKQQVKDCKETCEANLKVAKAEISTEIQTLKAELVDRIATNEETLRLHEKALEQLGKLIGSYTKEDLDEIIERIEELEKADIKLDERLVNAETKIKDLEPRVNKLEANVRALWDHMNGVENKLNTITPYVWDLVGKVKAIQSTLAKQVTGIIIQGTYNPMFGSFSIPADIQSNVLVAYYGKPASKVEFPTYIDSETGDGNYVRKKEVLTAKDWQMISEGLTVLKKAAGTTLMNEDQEGNAKAGKVYMTINPNTANLEGLKLDIVNTQDEVSPITLSPIKKSYTTLQFGYGRADNGFYESNASIKKENLAELEKSISEESLQGIIDEARTKIAEMGENFFKTTGASGDLGGLATQIYNTIHEMKVDRQGLKCTYTDTDSKGVEQQHSVYSQYNLATTVMRPLNLKSFKDLTYATIPGYEDAEDLLDDIVSTLQDHVNVLFTDANASWKVNKLVYGLEIDGVSLADYTDNLIARFKVRVSHFTLNGVNYELTIPGTGSLDIKFAKDLKANGSAVNIPAAVTYDESNPSLTKATLVIGGDVVTGMTTALIIPAVDGDGLISAYAYIDLIDTSVKATLDGSDIQIWSKEDGTFNVATYAGGSINVTTGTLVLQNLVGTEGYVDIPVAREIADDSQKIVDTLKSLVAEMNETLEKINKYEGIIDGWIDDFVSDYLRKYLDKINHTAVYFVNSTNRRFGPFLVASDGNGFKRLSTTALVPTELEKNKLTLYPTTKNMELIVPLAKKHVAVTNVYNEAGKSAQKDNDANLIKALKDANSCEEMNTVIDGTNRRIFLDASKLVSGYIYEFAYSVLDFEGNISTSKYYVKIK